LYCKRQSLQSASESNGPIVPPTTAKYQARRTNLSRIPVGHRGLLFSGVFARHTYQLEQLTLPVSVRFTIEFRNYLLFLTSTCYET
jgi:hypothetical protein